MQITSLLVGDKSPEEVAENFITYFLRRCNRTNTLCLHLVLQFAEGIFTLIDFKCYIKSTYVRTGNYEWPESLNIYEFPYNPLIFGPLATFLTHISSVVMQRQESEQETHLSGGSKGGGKDPIVYFIELLNIWREIYSDLQRKDAKGVFKEPLARINLSLLKGLHPLRKMYNMEYKELDVLCDRFLRSALQGLFYTESHTDVVDDLSVLFCQDFPIFYQHSADSLDFIYKSFSVADHTVTSIKMYKLLKAMMENSEWTQTELLNLTNYLIEEKMQEVYFTTYKFDKSKRLLNAALEFLDVLQSKLPSVECFSQPFIVSIWMLIFNKDCSNLAASLYITIMKRKYYEDIIIKHILETYYSEMNSTELLPAYIVSLGSHFDAIYDVDIYIKCIQSTELPNLFRSFAAHFMVYVYRNMQEDFDKFKSTTEHLLLSLPSVLNKLTCQIILGILLQIYAFTNFNDVQTHFSNSSVIFTSFEKFAFTTFVNSNHEYPLLKNLFFQVNRTLHCTRNWYKLEKCSVSIYNLFRKLEKIFDNESVYLPSIKSLYNSCLKKLSILLQTNYNIFDDIADLQRSISKRLIETPQINKFAEETNLFHDVYAMEILTSCLRLQTTSSEITACTRNLILTYTKSLLSYFVGYLRNVENLQKMPLVRIKTIFCCFIDLLVLFNDECGIHKIKLSPQNYSILVEIIVLIIFETRTFNCNSEEVQHMHPMRILEYQNCMLQSFTKLHACAHVSIPANIVWKICIYYHLSDHKFNSCLEELLKVLATKRFAIYKHVMPVFLYNLYNRLPPLKDHIQIQCIKAHKNFIKHKSSINGTQELIIHIILTILQIVHMAIKHKNLNAAKNRVTPLKHLHILVDDFVWTDQVVLDLIINQANNIKTAGFLNLNELKSLESFVAYFKNCRKIK